ncbi:hypothetical protein IMSHALPRED_003637 [Imshaugia aleurites]|uniref:Rhodopsin domain-containing protein n=1 Tax=Imshaugia aleurites TaxID=172621 RepID=A0A8H3J833_9LECA|nr:hypothetical protein IMSHALPRED_003637 [Imshaugia aleurites]
MYLDPTHGDSLGITVIVLDALFLGLAAVAIGIRLWARKIQGLDLSLNDYAAVLAWPLAAGLVTTCVIGRPSFLSAVAFLTRQAVFQDGGGKRMYLVKPANIPEILKSYLAANIAWAAANTSIKISIVHFYITVFRSNKAFLKVAYAVIAAVISFGVGIVLCTFLICRPIAKFWYSTLPGNCGNFVQFLLALSICNVAIDLTIILLPIPMIWWLQTSKRRKMELTITFTLGLVICAITTIRVILAVHFKINDFTNGIARIGIVTTLEPLLGIIVACLPMFPPALKRIFGSVKKISPETQHGLSSSMVRLRPERSKNSTPNRFDESWLLTDLENNRIGLPVSGPSSKPNSLIREGSQSVGTEMPPQSSITVRHEWVVRSEAIHLGAQR